MKPTKIISGILLLSSVFGVSALSSFAERLVILHTNDTHSNIDTDDKGRGGILPRKAIIDSVRAKEKNVLLVDAGDAVQGTLYFKIFRGDVEYPLFNMMDYDVRILGNHEFDNGLDDLARYWKDVKAARLSANYDFSGTPADGIFSPYVIKKIGNKKVGLLGINIDPADIIVEENYKGMKMSDIISTANKTASILKKKGCDLVVAVTHIGYDEGAIDDRALAAASKDIDIIIGGHSHTFIDPDAPDPLPFWFKNSVGRDVLVTQTGKYGANVGYIALDLNNFRNKKIDYKLIPVTDRFDPKFYSDQIRDFLAPFKHKVDSINSRVIGWNEAEMENVRSASPFGNWAGDFSASFGRQIADSLRAAGVEVPHVDFGLMNVGGIRQPMPAGVVSEGQILSTFPFDNKIRIIEISGRDIIETMKIVAPKGGEAVSSEVRVITDADGNYLGMTVDGVAVAPEKKYVVATIDYIANGKDGMVPMKNHREIWRDSQEVSLRIIDYIDRLTANGLPIAADPTPRFVVTVKDKLK